MTIPTNVAFEDQWNSLEHYTCPDWFCEAKLGIWAITGPQSVPLKGDWYARNMYIEGHIQYEHHLRHYGHPSEFGYKDIIKLYNPIGLDFSDLAKRFSDAGAKYAAILAMHHDNFDLWNSKHQPWNAVNMNPGRDLVGEFKQAVTSQGMRFGATTHLARSYNWFQTNKGCDSKGPMKGIPYDGNNPDHAALYHPAFEQNRDTTYYPINPPVSWKKHWYDRIRDLIDQHQPDLLYFDGGYPFNECLENNSMDEGATGRRLVADYYNASMNWHGGQNEAAMCIKNITDGTYGGFREGTCIEDIERGRMTDIASHPWQTDTCIGVWYYEEGLVYKKVASIIHQLIDIVSKNGNLLLNIPIHPQGFIDEQEKTFLQELGQWMNMNGGAIYGTRPWIKYGEGIEEGGGHFNEKSTTYSSTDFRFNKRGTNQLNIFFMKWPDDGMLLVRSLGRKQLNPDNIKKLQLCGQTNELKYEVTEQGLRIQLPEQHPCLHAWAIELTTKAEI